MQISDKLNKVNDSFSVTIVDNGFLFEISGHDVNDDWKTVKLVTLTIEQLFDLVSEAAKMEKT